MNREKLKEQLLTDEGLRLKPYKCTAGKTSIGVGRNLDDVGISKAEAMVMLNNDIDNCARDLDKALPWWRELDDARQNVLLNMCFNLGINRLLGFKKTLGLMQAKRYDAAAAEMLDSKWADDVGLRAARLARVMRTGVLP